MRILNAAVSAAKTALGVVDKEAKRTGLYVYRPVLNGQEWHDWAVRHGVPSPLAADDMHVTQVYSQVNVQMIPDKTVKSIYIGPGYGDAACFAQLGPKGESLVVCFGDWDMYNRHYNFLANGAVSTYPTYRPHMTITNATGDFELSDEALADAPIYINLGAEVFSDIKQPPPSDENADGAEDVQEGDGDLILVIAIAASAAQAVIDKSLKDSSLRLNPMDRYALADMAAGREVEKGVVRRIAATDWAPEAIKALVDAAPAPTVVEIAGKKYREAEMTMTVAPIPADLAKKLNRTVDAFKLNEEEKLAYGWASVSTIKGELVEDLQGDTITTKAQRQWLHSLMKGQRYGLMEHEGTPIAEVVEGIVFDSDLQKALGIDLGMEGVLCCTHYICEKTWAMVKTGDWMHSIAGRVLIEVEE